MSAAGAVRGGHRTKVRQRPLGRADAAFGNGQEIALGVHELEGRE